MTDSPERKKRDARSAIREVPDVDRPSAWIVSFGPVGSGADGYLIRVEANSRALAGLGYEVSVLEVSTRSQSTNPWPHVTTCPAAPWLAAQRRILGPVNLLADLRAQLALAVGTIRNWRSLRAADLVVIEGGLLALTLCVRLSRRNRRPIVVFDLITLMSSLHRDPPGRCIFQCKVRRRIWRVLELVCVKFCDVSVAGSIEDANELYSSNVKVVPHALIADPQVIDVSEKRDLVGFLGSGHVVPNREALSFIALSVLRHAGLETVRCRVIGQKEGYSHENSERLEFVGFRENPATALAEVSVGCAPMDGAGGVSTKVLAYLAHGKRTVCTPEAAHGIARPFVGLWVAERADFAQAVADALAFPWSAGESHKLREWMHEHHGLGGLQRSWQEALSEADGGRSGASSTTV